MSDRKTLEEQAEKILALAEERGIQGNFFFRTTFDRYLVQLRILNELEQAIDEYGATVTKTYVKGRENIMSNPAIKEYNRTVSASNGTVSALINIIKSFQNEDDGGGKLDEFMSALNG